MLLSVGKPCLTLCSRTSRVSVICQVAGARGSFKFIPQLKQFVRETVLLE